MAKARKEQRRAKPPAGHPHPGRAGHPPPGAIEPVNRLFGRRLRDIRKARKLTQEGLAALVGKDYTFIGALERGEQSPRLETLDQIARALDMTVAELLEFPEQGPARSFSYAEAAHHKIYGLLAEKGTDFQDKVLRVIEILSKD